MSVKEDLDPDVAKDIVGYLKKKCRYGFVVLEQSAKWHMHAVVCFTSPIEKKHFEQTLWGKCEKAHPTSIKRIALKSVVQHDHDWITNYLQKDSAKRVLWQKYDEEEYTKFFPSQEEQAELIAAAASNKPSSSEAKDPRMTRLESEWIEYSTDDSYESACRFLNYSMNVARTMPCICDSRRLNQLAWTLHRYRTHAVEMFSDQIRHGSMMTGIGPFCI